MPPIVIRLLRTQETCSKYDLSSVRFVYTGAAPTGQETIDDLRKIYPKWHIGQGYGEQASFLPRATIPLHADRPQA